MAEKEKEVEKLKFEMIETASKLEEERREPARGGGAGDGPLAAAGGDADTDRLGEAGDERRSDATAGVRAGEGGAGKEGEGGGEGEEGGGGAGGGGGSGARTGAGRAGGEEVGGVGAERT